MCDPKLADIISYQNNNNSTKSMLSYAYRNEVAIEGTSQWLIGICGCIWITTSSINNMKNEVACFTSLSSKF